jgi:hypothetical protein
MTFGVFALLKSLGERHFIQRMNETDVVTRSAFAGALSDEYGRRGRC